MHYTMYRYENVSAGQCIRSRFGDAQRVLARNGITYKGNPTRDELVALAQGIGQVERLLGAPLPETWRTPYNYVVGSGNWSQQVSAIQVRRPKGSDKGQNVTRLMHELGHKVGNVGRGQIYAQYQAFTKGAECQITGYAGHKENEEFAEVFAAFVTYPELLQHRCPKAFEFMAKKLFPNSRGKLASCSRASLEPTTLVGEASIPTFRPTASSVGVQ